MAQSLKLPMAAAVGGEEEKCLAPGGAVPVPRWEEQLWDVPREGEVREGPSCVAKAITSGAERSGKSIWLKVSGYRREQPLLVPPAPGALRSQAWAIRRAALELWKKQPALLHMV